MPAGVEEHAYPPVGAATSDYRFLAHEPGDKIARIRDLAFVPNIQPTAREDPFLLGLMDFRIGKDPWADAFALEIDKIIRIEQLIFQLVFAPIVSA
jgi:hypothetical protein